MKVKDLILHLSSLPHDAEVMIVASDMGRGGDTYAPLDDITTQVGGHVLLGATAKMCGDRATDHRDPEL